MRRDVHMCHSTQTGCDYEDYGSWGLYPPFLMPSPVTHRWFGPQGGVRLRANSGFELRGTKRAQAKARCGYTHTRYSARKIELGKTPSCSPKSDKLRGLTTHICTDVRRTHKHGPRQGSALECDARSYSERSRCDNTDPLLSAMISHTNNTNTLTVLWYWANSAFYNVWNNPFREKYHDISHVKPMWSFSIKLWHNYAFGHSSMIITVICFWTYSMVPSRTTYCKYHSKQPLVWLYHGRW